MKNNNKSEKTEIYLTYKRKRCNASKPTVVTFLGFNGHIDCMSSIKYGMISHGYDHIEASPEESRRYSFYTNFFEKIDAYSMQTRSVHLGLGSVCKQSLGADIKLSSSKISSKTPIILCGHSQGGLIAIEFWKRFAHKYDIRGIITITAPLQGVSILQALNSARVLNEIYKYSSKNKIICKTLPVIIPFILFPITRGICYFLSPCMRDFFRDQGMASKNLKQFYSLRRINLPFLNIVASCPAPVEFSSLPFGTAWVKSIISGGIDQENDNILAVSDQCMPIDWANLTQMHVQADHGAFNVPGYKKVFFHQDVVDAILKFCDKTFF